MASVDPIPRINITRSLFNAGLVLFWSLIALALVLIFLDWILRPDTWPVRSVSYEGPFHHVTRQELEQRTMADLTGNFLTADLPRVQQSVEALPWVAKAWVSRRWPSSVHVRFTEQDFVARWGDSSWINSQGQVVMLPNHDGPKNVVQLAGPEGSAPQVLKEYQTLASMLEVKGLHVDQLKLTDRRTWRLRLHNGISMLFGHEPPKPAVQRFLDAYPYLSGYMARIQRIDLRYENGFAVGWKDGKAVPIHLAQGKEG